MPLLNIRLAAAIVGLVAYALWQTRQLRHARQKAEADLRRTWRQNGLPWPEPGDAAVLVDRSVVERRFMAFCLTPYVALVAASLVSVGVQVVDPERTDLASFYLMIVSAMSTLALAKVASPTFARWRVRSVRTVANLRARHLSDYLTRRSLVAEAMAAVVVVVSAAIALLWARDAAAIAPAAIGVVTLTVSLVGQGQLLRASTGVGSPDGLLWDEFLRVRGLYGAQHGLVMAATFVPQGALLSWHPTGGLRVLSTGAFILGLATLMLALVVALVEGSENGAATRARALLNRPTPAAP